MRLRAVTLQYPLLDFSIGEDNTTIQTKILSGLARRRLRHCWALGTHVQLQAVHREPHPQGPYLQQQLRMLLHHRAVWTAVCGI